MLCPRRPRQPPVAAPDPPAGAPLRSAVGAVSSGRENRWGRGGGGVGLGGGGGIDGEYDAWDPHVVVGVEYEL
jgi:hypothetical protein